MIFFLRYITFLIGIFSFTVGIGAIAHAQVSVTDLKFTGDFSKVCTALKIGTLATSKSSQFIKAKKQQKEYEAEIQKAFTDMITDIQTVSEVSIDDVDKKALATVFSDIAARFEKVSKEKPESQTWSSFDVARNGLSAAGIADPTGAVNVVAAYFYPKCGSKQANESQGSFCWKDSYGRTAGKLPKNLGTPAFCPAGLRNGGLICVADRYGAPSVLPNCPQGYTNIGLHCRRPARAYKTALPVSADCPSGFTNTGFGCRGGIKKGFKKLGKESMTCPRGRYRIGFMCHVRCSKGYTRLLKRCRRPVDRLGLSKMKCPRGYFKGKVGARCYKKCKAGYKNIGEICRSKSKPVDARFMTCKNKDVYKGGRCYGEDTCGKGNEFSNIGLCYPKCKSSFRGIGPVCWGQCTGRYKKRCGAGCATSKA